ncbi:Fe(3+)-hydroxamate ABC transporter permease FhuB [Mesorhizobium sp. SB112]|uniref:Fe(3+)-hydroxamate ABC transporter permease FhuB n=1 Tax=Mesorhizobium sp. SB112 TaxID=3151853 RepID=UPI00326762F7
MAKTMLRRGVLLWFGLALLAAMLFAFQVSSFVLGRGPALPADLDSVIFFNSVLPRAAIALISGAALGLSGLLLQRVLRNPLAEPSTLGVAAGAQLAMAASTIYAPFLMENAREGVALVGGVLAVALILSLTWRRGLEPVSVVLAGMMTALTATAASAALILANGEYMFSLFIWGGGSLTQQSWDSSIAIAWRFLPALFAAVLLLRPLAILALDDASARSLGIGSQTTRFMVIAIAIWLATTVTAHVGVIGFVGLAAPALAQLSGARSLKQRLVAAPLIGAILLWLTDGLVQLFAGSGGERIPTGAATALLGGPLLLWLLPRLRMFEWPTLNMGGAAGGRARNPVLLSALIGVAVLLIGFVALSLGRGTDGWNFATGDLFSDLMPWRLPRVIVAATAGAMLAAAGAVLQRITANPLASPEILGVGSGAGVGLAAALFLFAAPSLPVQLVASAIGATLVLLAMLIISRRGRLGPERLLLAGVAMGALCSAVLTAIIATGKPEAFGILRWLSGSTNDVTPEYAWYGIAAAIVLLLPLMPMARWLEVLPLGEGTARSLGVPLNASRTALVLLAGLLTATAALFVGPLSFIGLIAPHLSRLVGFGRVLPHLFGAILIGSGLMVLSDWLARMVAFPYQLPLGLFASLLGGPYLVWLLGRGRVRNS